MTKSQIVTEAYATPEWLKSWIIAAGSWVLVIASGVVVGLVVGGW